MAGDDSLVPLQQWLKQNGMDTSNLKPAIFKDTGRGLMAMKDLKEGDKVISVPEHLLISTKVVLKGDLGEALKRYHKKLTPLQCLCSFFIHEKEKGPKSYWHRYIDSLPKEFNTPAYFSRDELPLLPKHLQEKTDEHSKAVAKNYEDVRLFISFAKQLLSLDKFCLKFEDFLWAWFVINTRTLYMDHGVNDLLKPTEKDCYVMAPYLDLLNHSAYVEVQASFNVKTRCYEIHTKTPVKKSEQVFIHYGPHDNSTLLLEYGFILSRNPHNVVNFDTDEVLHQCERTFGEASHKNVSIWNQKLEIIEKNSLTDLSCSAEGISWHLECLLTILALSDADMKQDVWKKVLWGNPVSMETRRKCLVMAEEVLQSRLYLSKTALQVIKDFPHKTYHTEMAANMRQDELDILNLSLTLLDSAGKGQ